MTSERILQVFREILGSVSNETPTTTAKANSAPCRPTYDDLTALAELLADNADEQAFQLFITKRPQFLVHGFGDAGNHLAFVTKPQISNRYRADFATLSFDQGGGTIQLVELEESACRLFTKAGTPARRLQTAIGQVRDWDTWIRQNQQAFVDDILDRCTGLPVYPQRSTNGSFLLVPPQHFRAFWKDFAGTKYIPFPLQYLVYIGRWSQLSEGERERLCYLNDNHNSPCTIRTFESLALNALYGLMRPGQ